MRTGSAFNGPRRSKSASSRVELFVVAPDAANRYHTEPALVFSPMYRHSISHMYGQSLGENSGATSSTICIIL